MNVDNNILISGLNWLGDSIMSMPAIQSYKKYNPEISITMLVKRGMFPLWQMHADIDNIVVLNKGISGALNAAKQIKELRISKAYIFPNSFRSALVPALAGIPLRIGYAGHMRRMLLTNVIGEQNALHKHQSFEYLDILGLDDFNNEELPKLIISSDFLERIKSMANGIFDDKVVAVLPGAAFGDAKRWPIESFIESANLIKAQKNVSFIVLGTQKESSLGDEFCKKFKDCSINLAGKTSLPDFAAALSLSDVVMCNDSGGMHLASAVGTKVVAIFGMTDPVKTGPIGESHKIIMNESVKKTRDIKRDDPFAIDAIRAIKPISVAESVVSILRDNEK